MALADSSENAILDLSKKLNKRELDSGIASATVSNLMSNSLSYPLDQFKMFAALPSNVMLDNKYTKNDRDEANDSTSPDSQLYNRINNGNVQSQNSFPIIGDMHSFRENMFTTSILTQSEQEASNMRMRTLPHRKRPIALLNSSDDCDDFKIKMMKTNYHQEVRPFVPDKNEDQDSSDGSRSPELFSPVNTPDDITSNSNQNLDDKSHSPSEGASIKSASRLRGGQLKDEAYWERRRKNNEAAKRSRDTRKQKEEETAHKARSLAQENISLRAEINILRTQLCNMQSMLFYRNNTPSHM